jgi:GTP cyclohydrolase II
MSLPLLRPVERAAGALRRSEPVLVGDPSGALLVHAAETLRAPVPDHEGWRVLLTHARAATLKIRLYTPRVVVLDWPASRGLEVLKVLIDPTADLAHPLMGPFSARRDGAGPAAEAAVKLAKLAGLLPAAVVRPVSLEEAARLEAEERLERADAAQIAAYDEESAAALKPVTRARVPLAGAEDCEVYAFRASDGGPEHLAILVGSPSPPGPVLARLHSECFTGDLLGSLKCDCGDQLKGAIRLMAATPGGGVLLYLAQEGRGIGLVNKLRAYRLQDQGFDTIEANERLGFGADERVFRPAATMLKALGFAAVRLMTNNPEKAAAMEQLGIAVAERVGHSFPANPHNAAYLTTKRDRAGHDL